MSKLITSIDDFIQVQITPEMYENAVKTANEYQHKLNNSIRNGKGTLVGCLGEEMIKKTFPFLKRLNTFQFDFQFNDKRLEIKTKERTVPPQINYECSVNELNGRQDTDFYIFTSVMNTYDVGWILGYIKKEKMWESATIYNKGDIDPRNNFRFHCKTYNLYHTDLYKFKGNI